MGALERQEDKSSAHASSGPISVCVVSSRHAVKQNHHGSMQPGDNIDVFLLPSRPMTFHNVIVVLHPAAEVE